MTTTSEEFEKATDFAFKEEDIDAAKALVGVWTGSTRQEHITEASYDNMRNFARELRRRQPALLVRRLRRVDPVGWPDRRADATDRDEPAAARPTRPR